MSFTVSVTHAPNRAPEADLATLLEPQTEIAYRFDASEARDPDGRIVRYRWDFGDGATSDRPVIDHVYICLGIYEGSLTLTDNSGLENVVTTLRSLAIVYERPNEQPVAAAGPDRFAIVGRPVTFDGGGSTDGYGSLTRFDWDFGNGKTAVGQQRSIVYYSPGRYDVILTVIDNYGQDNASHSDTLTVVVRDRENNAPIARLEEDRPRPRSTNPFRSLPSQAVISMATSSPMTGISAMVRKHLAARWFISTISPAPIGQCLSYATTEALPTKLPSTSASSRSTRRRLPRRARNSWSRPPKCLSMRANPKTRTARSFVTRGISAMAKTAPARRSRTPIEAPGPIRFTSRLRTIPGPSEMSLTMRRWSRSMPCRSSTRALIW